MITINKMVADSITITTGPVVKAETHIKFVDGTEGDYLIEGVMNSSALVAAGLKTPAGPTGPSSWIKYPAEVYIGSAVTSIGTYVFLGCSGLTNTTIPDSVTSIESYAFSGCSSQVGVTFSGRDKATVQNMSNYSWGFTPGVILHCTDGDITIS